MPRTSQWWDARGCPRCKNKWVAMQKTYYAEGKKAFYVEKCPKCNYVDTYWRYWNKQDKLKLQNFYKYGLGYQAPYKNQEIFNIGQNIKFDKRSRKRKRYGNSRYQSHSKVRGKKRPTLNASMYKRNNQSKNKSLIKVW